MKNNKNKKIIIIAISCIILMIGIITTTIIIVTKDDDNDEQIVQKEKIDEMQDYDYYLEDNATEYYKELYNNLKDILKEEQINEEEYAKIVAQLFVTDLFTLNNKITSSDIGGLQFIYTDFKEDFINITKTGLYSSIESNIYGDRNQELPIVRKVEVINIEKSTFTYNDKKHESYKINLTLEYEKDLGYPIEYNLVLIKNDKYLQVAKGE